MSLLAEVLAILTIVAFATGDTFDRTTAVERVCSDLRTLL